MRNFHPIAPTLVTFVGASLATAYNKPTGDNVVNHLAAIGAVFAVIGIFTMGRPIVRLGYAEWLRQSRSIDGGKADNTPSLVDEDARDALAVQLYGPIVAASGTLLNGFSGLLGQLFK
jgi:heme/copper-type cytochrome/quinol oxidase subunit 1